MHCLLFVFLGLGLAGSGFLIFLALGISYSSSSSSWESTRIIYFSWFFLLFSSLVFLTLVLLPRVFSLDSSIWSTSMVYFLVQSAMCMGISKCLSAFTRHDHRLETYFALFSPRSAVPLMDGQLGQANRVQTVYTLPCVWDAGWRIMIGACLEWVSTFVACDLRLDEAEPFSVSWGGQSLFGCRSIPRTPSSTCYGACRKTHGGRNGHKQFTFGLFNLSLYQFEQYLNYIQLLLYGTQYKFYIATSREFIRKKKVNSTTHTFFQYLNFCASL